MKSIAQQSFTEFGFPVTLILTVIVCLGAMQACGVKTELSLATAAAALVFCSRIRRPTLLDFLDWLCQPPPFADGEKF